MVQSNAAVETILLENLNKYIQKLSEYFILNENKKIDVLTGNELEENLSRLYSAKKSKKIVETLFKISSKERQKIAKNFDYSLSEKEKYDPEKLYVLFLEETSENTLKLLYLSDLNDRLSDGIHTIFVKKLKNKNTTLEKIQALGDDLANIMNQTILTTLLLKSLDTLPKDNSDYKAFFSINKNNKLQAQLELSEKTSADSTPEINVDEIKDNTIYFTFK